MDRERLKLIVRNMESLVNALKSELESDKIKTHEPVDRVLDYDEVFDEDDY